MEQIYLNGFSVISFNVFDKPGAVSYQRFGKPIQSGQEQETQPGADQTTYWYVVRNNSQFEYKSITGKFDPPEDFYIGPFLSKAQAAYVVQLGGELADYFTRNK